MIRIISKHLLLITTKQLPDWVIKNVIKVTSSITAENIVNSLDDLIDVDLSGGSVNGSVLVYNSTTNNYESTNIIDGGSY